MKITITQVAPEVMGQEKNPFSSNHTGAIFDKFVEFEESHPPLPIHTQSGPLEGCKVGETVDAELVWQANTNGTDHWFDLHKDTVEFFDNMRNWNLSPTRRIYLITEAKETPVYGPGNDNYGRDVKLPKMEAKETVEESETSSIELAVTHHLRDSAMSANGRLIFLKGAQFGAEWQKQHTAATNRDEWISVDERLPEETTDVMFYNSGYKLILIGRLYDRDSKVFWDQSADTHTKVTHWQPLPKAPTQQTN